MAEKQTPDEPDDARDRFRAALDRKKAQHGGGHAAHDPAKPVAPSANPRSQRMFRRKSG